MADQDYIQKQADLLFKQWEFYQNLTWRIPTMVITVNGALLAIFNIAGMHAPLCMPYAFLFVGLITLVNAYRLHRANCLSRQIMLELRTKLNDKYGEEIIHTTSQMKWSWLTRWSSRTLTVWVLVVWGVFLLIVSANYFAKPRPCQNKTHIVEQSPVGHVLKTAPQYSLYARRTDESAPIRGKLRRINIEEATGSCCIDCIIIVR